MSMYGFDQQVHGHTTTIGKYRGNLAGVNGSTKGLQDAKILFLFFCCTNIQWLATTYQDSSCIVSVAVTMIL